MGFFVYFIEEVLNMRVDVVDKHVETVYLLGELEYDVFKRKYFKLSRLITF